MQSSKIERLINIVGRLPGMGERSAHRIVVHLLSKKNTIMENLLSTLNDVYKNSTVCQICNNICSSSPCNICSDKKRDRSVICVVSSISDLWSIERAEFYNGVYHILGGKLSAIDGVRPEDLDILKLKERIIEEKPKEIILAMSADIDGQTTMFFVKDCMKDISIKITTLSHGMPIGGDFDYLDEGTIIAAFSNRKNLV
jgi:recombination protein RecR